MLLHYLLCVLQMGGYLVGVFTHNMVLLQVVDIHKRQHPDMEAAVNKLTRQS
jgi:hypothetical protein